jgi:hypothetical protein
MQQQRERRYPPSPYPPHSARTLEYRTHWDLGWRHLGTMAGELILSFEADLRGASRHGYRDGLLARWSYIQRAKQTEPEILRQERQMREVERAAAAAEERPY